MKKITSLESSVLGANLLTGMEHCWFDDACILDVDYFVKTLSGIKAKGVRPDLIGSIISHYACKWLPDLSGDHDPSAPSFGGFNDDPDSPESMTSQWMRKRFFVETIVGVLPPERDSVPCNFLLRLLRTASMVGAEPSCQVELEQRIAGQLDGATLKELMIPSFSHTCRTLLDVDLVVRLVRRFLDTDEAAAATRSGAVLVKVAKLIDGYMAEAALEPNLTVAEFVALAGALPSHSRATDDGLYRAVDTYLKAHPNLSKQERKALCRLMDSRKLTVEASLHAAQNERLPVRAVIQVLFSEHNKLSRHLDWSGSFNGARSPSGTFEPTARCLSKRETSSQQAEIRRLREDVSRLQSVCNVMQAQMERMQLEKKKGTFFRWKKLGLMPSFRNLTGVVAGETAEEGRAGGQAEVGYGRLTPVDVKSKLVKGRSDRTPPKWRKSAS